MIFYLTFGQSHPLRDAYIEIYAENNVEAREQVFSAFGQKWSGLYEEKNFKKELFPQGKVGEMR